MHSEISALYTTRTKAHTHARKYISGIHIYDISKGKSFEDSRKIYVAPFAARPDFRDRGKMRKSRERKRSYTVYTGSISKQSDGKTICT